MLQYFFVKKSEVFSELTLQEKMGLAAVYPDEHYRAVLPYINLEKQRDNVRYQVNLIGQASSHQKIKSSRS